MNFFFFLFKNKTIIFICSLLFPNFLNPEMQVRFFFFFPKKFFCSYFLDFLPLPIFAISNVRANEIPFLIFVTKVFKICKMMISDKLGFSLIHWPSKICNAIHLSILKRDLKKLHKKKYKKMWYKKMSQKIFKTQKKIPKKLKIPPD